LIDEQLLSDELVTLEHKSASERVQAPTPMVVVVPA
jgi:hypothetical protein